MDLSVLIPTHGRPAKVAACVRALAAQTLAPDRYEVLVGLDGPDEAAAGAIREAWAEVRREGRRGAAASDDGLKVIPCRKQGQAGVRNGLLRLARGTTLVFLNDDMIPARDHLECHLEHQLAEQSRGRPALVVGASPWRVHQPDRLFDRLIRETSMVFFYDQMDRDPDPRRDWGFRHAWLLNLSAPAALVREVGGFTIFPQTYGYEDDDLAFRLRERFGTPVLYRPDARAEHDHRMDPADYLAREERLGHAALGFARVAPACALAMFGRDITGDAEIAYSREFVERERALAERLRESFVGLADMPSTEPSGPHSARLLALLYQQHLPLKRWHWRQGLLRAAAELAR
ncbi:MAG: glycosyltransferase family 2 protein [Phycisphaerae bacterium]|nr:glycosyltransferase family 2 protein [Phycisphaerae bacterium]